jgi:hypothetical protein
MLFLKFSKLSLHGSMAMTLADGINIFAIIETEPLFAPISTKV